MRKNALIARKQGVWQGYLTCEKAEKGREISDRIGAKGSAKKGQKRRELTNAVGTPLRASDFVGVKTTENKKGVARKNLATP